MIVPVILCGGDGARLWPLSCRCHRKPFAPLIDGQSLFELTLKRLSGFSDEVLVAASETSKFMTAPVMEALGISGHVLLEPEPRNTAAAMALVGLFAKRYGEDTLLLFCPADHYIPSCDQFKTTVLKGAEAALEGGIVTFGVVPTGARTAYGYIETGAAYGEAGFLVERFIEKPDADLARELIDKGAVLWNAGIFLCRARTLLDALTAHAPDVLAPCMKAMEKPTSERFSNRIEFHRPEKQAFLSAPSTSIDYAVMEKQKPLVVVPFGGAWSDLGSWQAIAGLHAADPHQNRIEGQGRALQTRDTYIHAPAKAVVALGVDDLYIIDTPAAVLVAKGSHLEQIKEIANIYEADSLGVTEQLPRIYCQWGWYEWGDAAGDRQMQTFRGSRIEVKAGATARLPEQLSLDGHWVVVKGRAEISSREGVFPLLEAQYTHFPADSEFCLKNAGTAALIMMRVEPVCLSGAAVAPAVVSVCDAVKVKD